MYACVQNVVPHGCVLGPSCKQYVEDTILEYTVVPVTVYVVSVSMCLYAYVCI